MSEITIKFVEKVLEASKIKYNNLNITNLDIGEWLIESNGKEYIIHSRDADDNFFDFLLCENIINSLGKKYSKPIFKGLYNYRTNEVEKWRV